MLDILQQFHTYLPRTADGGYEPQLFAGDQVANGYTPEDRLEEITLQLGDSHADVKPVSLLIFYCIVYFV